MRFFARLMLIVALFCASLPIFAQEETPIDPEGEFTEVHTFENITINYPTGLVVTDANSQITIAFDEGSTITIATPAAFELLQIPHDTLEIASQSIFSRFAGGMGVTTTYEDTVTQTTIAGLDANYFMVKSDFGKVYVYLFTVGDDVFSVMLLSQGSAVSDNPIGEYETLAHFHSAVMVAIVETMTVDGEPIAQEVIAEATAEITAEATEIASIVEFETRPAPTDVVELGQDVIFVNAELTISIPAEWVVNDRDNIIATSDTALASMSSGQTPATEGEVAVQFISPRYISELPLDKITVENILNELLAPYPDSILYQYEDTAFPTYYATLVGGGVPEGTFIIAAQLSENPADAVILVGLTLDYDLVESTLFNILGTVVYTSVPK